MPILTYKPDLIKEAEIRNGDQLRIDFLSGSLTNITSGKTTSINPFYDAQWSIYQKGGLLG
jgi:hypothetical protein